MTLSESYTYCSELAAGHYENFPVASGLLPRSLRPHIAAVYAFARTADDIADEGDASPDERLRRLEAYRRQLDSSLAGEDGGHPVFSALANTVSEFHIPAALFHDLLDAFTQDAVQQRYEDFEDVLRYCSRSANPVGRIVLALFGILNEERAPYSDALCTGLQLANFWQDVSVDRLKPRVYIPGEDLRRFGVTEEQVLRGEDSEASRQLMHFQVERSREFFRAAMPLPAMVPLRLRLELRAIWLGGWSILDKIAELQYTTFSKRPALGRIDVVRILGRALTPTPLERPVHG